MSSSYSKGDVSDDVDALVRTFFRKYPKLLLLTSSVAAQLPEYKDQDIRDALKRECESGFLEAHVLWRCEECDSPADGIGNETVVDKRFYCRSDECKAEQNFKAYLYFQATATLLRRLRSTGVPNLKKIEAAETNDKIERIALSRSPPQDIDQLTEGDRAIIRELKEIKKASRSPWAAIGAIGTGITLLVAMALEPEKTSHMFWWIGHFANSLVDKPRLTASSEAKSLLSKPKGIHTANASAIR